MSTRQRIVRSLTYVPVLALIAIAVPAGAATDANNADKVDGKHAVSYTGDADERARKLVATNAQGVLPNNIIKMAPDAKKLGGVAADDYAIDTEILALLLISDGPGSGLDADTLDGMDPSSFAGEEHSHDDSYFTKDQLQNEGTLNDNGNPVDWTKLKGVPAELADGTDSDFGTPMVRWGNATAPAGTTLLHAGYAFGAHYTHANPTEALCIKGSDPGANPANPSGDFNYPVSTTAGDVPTGITANKLVRCAVFLPAGPAFVLWGSHTGPNGWTLVYKGYGMAGHYSHSGGPASRHCVDADSFDAGSPGSANSIWYPSIIVLDPTGGQYPQAYLKCSVWMMT